MHTIRWLNTRKNTNFLTAIKSSHSDNKPTKKIAVRINPPYQVIALMLRSRWHHFMPAVILRRPSGVSATELFAEACQPTGPPIAIGPRLLALWHATLILGRNTFIRMTSDWIQVPASSRQKTSIDAGLLAMRGNGRL